MTEPLSNRTDASLPASHLFNVRLWPEEVDLGNVEWRGKVQHVITGETRYFREWLHLPVLIRQMLEQNGNAPL
jgi:hypothetical protein